MKIMLYIVFVALWLIVNPMYGDDYEIIKDLSPTHEVKVFRQLKIVKKIPFDFSNDDFIVQPTSITSDDQGNIYVYCGRRLAFYSFSQDGAFRFKFSGKGEGPGEMAAGVSGWYDVRKASYSKGVGILVNGFKNKWINLFSTTGKFLRVIPLPDAMMFYPLMDSKKNLYRISTGKGAVQVFNKDLKLVDTLLDDKELKRFFQFDDITPRRIKKLFRKRNDRIFYDWLSGNRFLIYLSLSSTVYIFKNRKLVDQYPVRPKKALVEREGRIKARQELKKTKKFKAILKQYPNFDKRAFKYHLVFRDLFVDFDSRNDYFLTSFHPIDQKQNVIFKFSVDGKALEAYYFNPPGSEREFCFFRQKRGGKFIGLGKKSIYICER